MTVRGLRVSALAKFLALAVYFGSLVPDSFARLMDIGGTGGKLAYAVLFLMAAAGILGLAAIRTSWLRWAAAAVFAVGAWFLDSYTRSALDFMTYGVFIDLINATGFTGDAVAQNRTAMMAALPQAVLLLLAIGLRPPQYAFVPQWLQRTVVFTPVAVIAAFTCLSFMRGGDGLKGQPAAYPAITYSLLAAYERLTGDLGPREDVAIAQTGEPLYRDIVLLIDESVTAHYLDINAKNGVYSGLEQPRPGLDIANFGIAASITNCSTGTNAALRYGGTRASYRRDIAVGPSLWAYAKKAGMETVYLDAQRTGGALQNGMDAAELALIDTFVQLDGVPVVGRDMALAGRLAQLLGDDRSSFIIANKVGAHFPVHEKYPEGREVYSPSLPRGGFADIVDTGSRAGFGGSEAEWQRYRNSYRNTLAWNTGAFFERLLGSANLGKTLIIYTSDHGQDLHEDKRGGTTTHCSSSPRAEEGAVPLVTLQGDGGPMRFNPQGAASHYMIAPTLLAAMGYDRNAVQARYGGALDQPSRDPGTFNTLFNARLNREPQWRKVDPREFVPVPGDTSGQ